MLVVTGAGKREPRICSRLTASSQESTGPKSRVLRLGTSVSIALLENEQSPAYLQGVFFLYQCAEYSICQFQ